jgi:hypothetical protein
VLPTRPWRLAWLAAPYAPALLIADASFFPNDHSAGCDQATVSAHKVSLMAAFGTIVMFIIIYTDSDGSLSDLGINVNL